MNELWAGESKKIHESEGEKKREREKANMPKHLMQTFKAKKEFNSLPEQKLWWNLIFNHTKS